AKAAAKTALQAIRLRMYSCSCLGPLSVRRVDCVEGSAPCHPVARYLDLLVDSPAGQRGQDRAVVIDRAALALDLALKRRGSGCVRAQHLDLDPAGQAAVV